jgi:cell wall-associated NlpC family hydrolase
VDTAVTQDELIASARTWIGVPFLHQGRTRFGVDCAGFVEALAKSHELLPTSYRAPKNYRRRPDGGLLEVVREHCDQTSFKPAPAATVVLIQWPSEKEPAHVALCTGPTLIHAYQRAGRVVENGYRGFWLRHTHSVWRLPGIGYV